MCTVLWVLVIPSVVRPHSLSPERSPMSVVNQHPADPCPALSLSPALGTHEPPPVWLSLSLLTSHKCGVPHHVASCVWLPECFAAYLLQRPCVFAAPILGVLFRGCISVVVLSS